MEDLRARSDLPWCVLGDFNEAMWSFEQLSKNRRPENQMLAFRDVLETCGLVDLGFTGYPFTYDNKRSGNNNVQVRLDRAVADNAWRNIFVEAHVKHLVSPCSDHMPFVLCCEKESGPRIHVNNARYEMMWEREASLPERVEVA
jgi:endonuclease/exonuclease/phosphatase family metal-dependent hydrolase